jgi:hypothetical protein
MVLPMLESKPNAIDLHSTVLNGLNVTFEGIVKSGCGFVAV